MTIFRLDSVIGSNLVNLQQHVYSNRPFLNSLPNKVPIRFFKYFLLQFSSCDKSSMAFNYPMFLKKSLPHHEQLILILTTYIHVCIPCLSLIFWIVKFLKMNNARRFCLEQEMHTFRGETRVCGFNT